jgi:hypothetical protein
MNKQYDDEKPMNKGHLFWQYFNQADGGVGNHEAAAMVYAAEVLYTALQDISGQLEDIAGTLRELKNKDIEQPTKKSK